jgi:hypothetical protein
MLRSDNKSRFHGSPLEDGIIISRGRGETLNHFEQIAPVTAPARTLLAVNLAAVGGALLLEQNNEGSEGLSPHRHAIGSATCRE